MRNKGTGKIGQMAIKLDIRKVYDPIEWEFLIHIMLKLGIDAQWVQLAMETVTSTTSSVIVNGEPKGFVTHSRDIRQGDPLFLYLFLLCAEGLSSLIGKAVGYVFLTFFLWMIALFSVELLWKNVIILCICLSAMRWH